MRNLITVYLLAFAMVAFTPHGLIPALLLFPLVFALRVAEEQPPTAPSFDDEYMSLLKPE